MKHNLTILIAFLATVMIAGCENTAEGAKQDAAQDSAAAGKKVRNAQENVGEAAKDMGSNMTMAPAIKDAIAADTKLNDPVNKIDVSATEERVLLTGYVATADLKDRAESLATKVIRDKNGHQAVNNQLVVGPRPTQ